MSIQRTTFCSIKIIDQSVSTESIRIADRTVSIDTSDAADGNQDLPLEVFPGTLETLPNVSVLADNRGQTLTVPEHF